MSVQIVEKHIDPDITMVEVSGRLAHGRDSQRLEALVDELIQRGSRKLVLDMTNVEYIDSAGIGLLALAAGKLREAGGRCVVVAAEGRVLHMLNVTQINSIVTVCGTPQAAAAAFA